MKIAYTILFSLLLAVVSAHAREPDGSHALAGGHDGGDWVAAAMERARRNAAKIEARRPPLLDVLPHSVELGWPVRKAITVDAVDIFGISNYVDQDTASGDAAIEDWNCGAPNARTYDGHNGIDIFNGPFSWWQMERDQAIVIAAAAGTIVDKVNDQPERSCTIDNSGGDNNLIVIEHSDGSLGLYAHMRTGSLTAKPIGATVERGEYLGVIGSAGFSTGPHLHLTVGFFEGNSFVHQEPWAGTCNLINATTWWEDQPAYYQPLLLDVATHDASPEFPPCPQTETPHYQNRFQAGDDIFVSINVRDLRMGDTAALRVKTPDGQVVLPIDYANNSVEHSASQIIWWGFTLPGNAPAGEWTFEADFKGDTLVHSFWVDAQPPGVVNPPAANNAYNGLWYDPTLDGEGLNIIAAESGLIVYFYGNDSRGNRLWLLSTVISEAIVDGKEVTAILYESTGGTHDQPIASGRGLSVWGTLSLTFTSCNAGVAVLTGEDGTKTSNLIKLTAVPGTACADPATEEATLSGLWFDATLEGEGFNLVITPFGAVIYYYGFDADGNRLWLVAGPLTGTLNTGVTVSADLLRAPSGTFDQPTGSDQLVKWGTIEVTRHSCGSMTYEMTSNEGDKTSSTVILARVTGLSCN